METMQDIAPRAAKLIATPEPSTTPANTLDFDWNFDTPTAEHRDAVNACARFCEDVAAKRYRWLSLLGKSGRGKTHLARRIDAWRQTRGKGLYFYRWLDLVAQFRGDRDTIPKFMERCDINRLLIVDDIGAGYETEFAAAVLAEIAERRVGKPTVFTSNLSLEQIAGIDSRIASRMFRGNSEVFTFKAAPDYCLPRRVIESGEFPVNPKP